MKWFADRLALAIVCGVFGFLVTASILHRDPPAAVAVASPPTRFWIGDTMDVVAYVQGAPITANGPDANDCFFWYYEYGSEKAWVEFQIREGTPRVCNYWQNNSAGSAPYFLKVGPHSYQLGK